MIATRDFLCYTCASFGCKGGISTKHLIFTLVGITQGILSVWILNRLPNHWLTEVDEEPSLAVTAFPRWSANPLAVVGALLLGGAAWLGASSNTPPWQLTITLILLQVLWMIALSDAKYQIIPDQFTLLLAVMGMLARLSQPMSLLTSVLPAMLVTVAIPALVGFLWSQWRNQDALGMGDLKLLLAFSLIFGWPMAGLVLFTGIMLAGLYFSLLLVLRKLQLSDHSALGPFLSLAAAVWLLGESHLMQVVNWYLSLF